MSGAIARTGRGGAGHTVAVMSNNHNVALAATVGTSTATHGRLILNSAARKIIAQDAPCTLEAPQVASDFAQAIAGPDMSVTDADSNRVTCAVSMP